MTPARLRAIFQEELALVNREFPRTRGVKLKVRAQHYLPASQRTSRDVAWYDPTTKTVSVVRDALGLPGSSLRGVIRHELGHAADRRIDDPECERRADRLSRQATGKPIRYDRHGLQNAEKGVARRPGWLHS